MEAGMVQVETESGELKSLDEIRAEKGFEAGRLTSETEDGKLSAVDQKRLTAVMRGLGSGELKHPRFTKEEAAASGGTEHERLWNFIISLESPEVQSGGEGKSPSRVGRDASQSGGWLGQLRRMATRYGSDPQELIDSSFKFLDKGAESHVYVGENSDKVLKIRKLSLNSLDGVKSALAKIVYHNYLFPRDAYTLRDIAVWENGGYDQFYLILEQPLVTPKTDARGNIVAPTEGQILEALNRTRQRFRTWDEAQNRGEAEDFDGTSSEGSGAGFVPSGRKIAYNGQFMVYDFKPGRNTFIDAETGEVRFIDPRVDVNDPNAGFSVSKFGKRKAVEGTAYFENQPSGEAGGEGSTGNIPEGPTAATELDVVDGAVGCARFPGAKVGRREVAYVTESGETAKRTLAVIEGISAEEMMAPENRADAVEFVKKIAEEQGAAAQNAAADVEAGILEPERSPSNDPSRTYPIAMGMSELVRMFRAMSGGAMPKVLDKRLRGERHGRWRRFASIPKDKALPWVWRENLHLLQDVTAEGHATRLNWQSNGTIAISPNLFWPTG